MKVLIIVPAYNEEKNLPFLIRNIRQVCPRYDILVINDCSSDNTCEICKTSTVNVINLPTNLGIGGAVQTGYKYALKYGYDMAIQVDGDGQHDPSYIDVLINEINKGANICIGSRFIDREGFQSTFSRRLGIFFFCGLISMLTSQLITDPTSGFRACDSKVIKLFAREYPVDFPEPETIVHLRKNNLKIVEVPVIMKSRDEGKSSITSLKSIYYMLKVSLSIIIASLTRELEKEEVTG